jgi:hypothetical protein
MLIELPTAYRIDPVRAVIEIGGRFVRSVGMRRQRPYHAVEVRHSARRPLGAGDGFSRDLFQPAARFHGPALIDSTTTTVLAPQGFAAEVCRGGGRLLEHGCRGVDPGGRDGGWRPARDRPVPQRPPASGFVNSVWAATYGTVVGAVILMMDPALADYHNEGSLRPISVIAPAGLSRMLSTRRLLGAARWRSGPKSSRR